MLKSCAEAAFFWSYGNKKVIKIGKNFDDEARIAYFEDNPEGIPTEEELQTIASNLVDIECNKLIDFYVVSKDWSGEKIDSLVNDNKDSTK